MWTAGDAGTNIPYVAMGIVPLGYILFGIMHHPAIAAAFYIHSYLAGDSAEVIVAAATLIVVALGAVWIRKSGVT